MSTQNLTQNPQARNGQPFPNTDNRIFEDWIANAEAAIDALFNWKAYLRAWQSHPQTGQLPDDLFMSVVQDMAQAGLMAWLDRPELDQLRHVITGGER